MFQGLAIHARNNAHKEYYKKEIMHTRVNTHTRISTPLKPSTEYDLPTWEGPLYVVFRVETKRNRSP